ncbi:hypothetical protein [Corynebacterium aurimucosum]|uniref:hypothetical protein n=1 Tax=Corynebacterium aurimucosum TaxID=169292 RepID=UPI001F38F637|nr:hypothetical protein [Corynebacterium aurimucosum]
MIERGDLLSLCALSFSFPEALPRVAQLHSAIVVDSLPKQTFLDRVLVDVLL